MLGVRFARGRGRGYRGLIGISIDGVVMVWDKEERALRALIEEYNNRDRGRWYKNGNEVKRSREIGSKIRSRVRDRVGERVMIGLLRAGLIEVKKV